MGDQPGRRPWGRVGAGGARGLGGFLLFFLSGFFPCRWAKVSSFARAGLSAVNIWVLLAMPPGCRTMLTTLRPRETWNSFSSRERFAAFATRKKFD